VLFVCVHNAGRSQMAAGFLTDLAGDSVEVRSAGSAPAEAVNPAAVAAMAEVGINIADQHPKILTADSVHASDVVITMGCGDTCPVFPGKTYLDWQLDDPAGGKASERYALFATTYGRAFRHCSMICGPAGPRGTHRRRAAQRPSRKQPGATYRRPPALHATGRRVLADTVATAIDVDGRP